MSVVDISKAGLIDEKKIASKMIEGEVVMIDLSNGMYYSLNNIGGFFWLSSLNHHSIQSILEKIIEVFNVPRDKVEKDLSNFVNQLIDRNLIALSDENKIENSPDFKITAEKNTYEKPVLNHFEDMKDLLALDPPLPGLEDLPS